MTVQKTRAKLVDVARQLFAKKGVEETTMNDIAVASKKGRRTSIPILKAKSRFTWPLWSLNWNFFRTR